MGRHRRGGAVAAALAAAVALRCAYFDTSVAPPDAVGAFTVVLQFGERHELAVYRLTVAAADMDTIRLYQLATVDSLRLTVPPGPARTFALEGFDRFGTRRYAWTAETELAPGAITRLQVALTALAIEPPPAPQNVQAGPAAAGAITIWWPRTAGACWYTVLRSVDTLAVPQTLATTTEASFTDTAVLCGTPYFYAVVAANEGGASERSRYIPASVACVVVPGLDPPVCQVSAVACTAISLQWEAVAGALSYRVYRYSAETPGGTRMTETPATSWVDTLVRAPYAYEYAVSSVDSRGESARSGRIAAAPPYCFPAPPRYVEAASREPLTVVVTWEPAPWAVWYLVWRVDGAAGAAVPVCSTAATMFRDTALAAGAVYSYRVASLNPAGQSSLTQSAPVTVMPPAPAPPCPLSATALSERTVLLTWRRTLYAASYSLERASSPSGLFAAAYQGPDTAWIDTGLSPSMSYTYRVHALNAGGQSSCCSPVTVVTLAPALQKPLPPAGLAASAVSPSSVRLRWDLSAGASWYRLYRSGSEAGPYQHVLEAAAPPVVDTPLAPLGTYWYRMSAGNAAGESDQCAPVKVVTPAAVTAPEGLSASAVSPASVTLSWRAVSNAVRYGVYRSLSQASGFVRVAECAAVTWVDSGLAPGTAYFYAVTAVAADGAESARCPAVSVSTPAAPPPVPGNVSATALSQSEIRIAWDASTGATSYRVYAAESSSGAYALLAQPGSVSYLHTGLAPATTRYYRVSACNSSGESALSTPVSATTQSVSIPATPGGLAATALSASEIRITFNPSASASSYRIYWSQSAGGPYAVLTALSATSYTHAGLSASTTYFYRVSAVNSAGESALSAAVQATTQAAVIYRTYAVIDPAKCQNCRSGCAAACPAGAIYKTTWSGKTVSAVNPALCTGCGACKTVCDGKGIGAITLVTEPVSALIKALSGAASSND